MLAMHYIELAARRSGGGTWQPATASPHSRTARRKFILPQKGDPKRGIRETTLTFERLTSDLNMTFIVILMLLVLLLLLLLLIIIIIIVIMIIASIIIIIIIIISINNNHNNH